MISTMDAARGHWHDLLPALGIDDKYLRNTHGNCPLCEGEDKFRFDDKGDGMWICNACGHGDGIELLRQYHGITFLEAAKQIDELTGRKPTTSYVKTTTKTDAARSTLRRIYGQSRPAIGEISPVTSYLKSRGLKPSPATRYVPDLGYFAEGVKMGGFPAMIHIIHAADGTPASIHRTFLTTRGTKADVPSVKKMSTPCVPMQGGAVRLFPAAERMGIAEGIETALAANEMWDIPVWAATTANMLEKFVPPPECKSIVIFGDNDASFAGQRATYGLAYRCRQLGLDVEIQIPETLGDWADLCSA